MRVFKNLGWFFKLEKKSYIIGLFMLVLVALMELVPPQVIGRVIDRITTETLTSNTLVLFGVLLIFVAVLTYIFRFFWRVMILVRRTDWGGRSVNSCLKSILKCHRHFSASAARGI
jgi:ABC-type multidrug transport system, ATPase and permease components